MYLSRKQCDRRGENRSAGHLDGSWSDPGGGGSRLEVIVIKSGRSTKGALDEVGTMGPLSLGR